MNFAPFGGQVPAGGALAPAAIQQFAAKLGYEGAGSEARYAGSGVQFAVAPATSVTLDGVKFRQAESVVVVSAAQPGTVTLAGLAPIHTVNTGVKYHTISSSSVNVGNMLYGGQSSYVQAETVQHSKTEQRADRRDFQDHHDLMHSMMQQQGSTGSTLAPGQQLLLVVHEPKDVRHIKQEQPAEFISIGDVTDTATWQTLTSSGVADYLSALPLPLHHLLKYAPADKRDDSPTIVTAVNNVIPVSAITQVPANSVVVQTATIVNQTVNSNASHNTIVLAAKKKKNKKCKKDKKARPRPGEIRLTTALDGSTLYCCPECHMAYPERGLLEQHLLGHTMERKFICDICNAALKRKDHLTRHKQSHNPERPHVCSVCLKAFKRKEQLTLHFVIHSGEKRHVCMECGKGFYRKDHLRKHTRSHIARRVKAELSQQSSEEAPLSSAPVSAPDPEPS